MTGTLFVRADGTSCGASMVKISADCQSEATRCQPESVRGQGNLTTAQPNERPLIKVTSCTQARAKPSEVINAQQIVHIQHRCSQTCLSQTSAHLPTPVFRLRTSSVRTL